MLDRKEILIRAIHECKCELYKKAQPSVDYDELLEKFRKGEITEDTKNRGGLICDRYYISHEELTYIRNKYLDAYGLRGKWHEYIDFIKDCLTKGGYRDKYVKDENGTSHRDSEKTPLLKDVIGEENAEKVINLINDLRNFYRFEREEESFNWEILFGDTPSTNKDTVIKYWKSQGVDITIEDRNPEEFWDRDYYGKEEWEQMKKEEAEENGNTDDRTNEAS